MNTCPPLISTSPSGAIRITVPGTARPTVPLRTWSGVLRVAPAAAAASPERCAAGDGGPAVSAEGCPQLAVDHPVEQQVWSAQQQHVATAPVERPAVGGGDRLRGVEDPALDGALGVRLALSGVVDLLEHPRHGQDEGGLLYT